MDKAILQKLLDEYFLAEQNNGYKMIIKMEIHKGEKVIIELEAVKPKE